MQKINESLNYQENKDLYIYTEFIKIVISLPILTYLGQDMRNEILNKNYLKEITNLYDEYAKGKDANYQKYKQILLDYVVKFLNDLINVYNEYNKNIFSVSDGKVYFSDIKAINNLKNSNVNDYHKFQNFDNIKENFKKYIINIVNEEKSVKRSDDKGKFKTILAKFIGSKDNQINDLILNFLCFNKIELEAVANKKLKYFYNERDKDQKDVLFDLYVQFVIIYLIFYIKTYYEVLNKELEDNKINGELESAYFNNKIAVPDFIIFSVKLIITVNSFFKSKGEKVISKYIETDIIKIIDIFAIYSEDDRMVIMENVKLGSGASGAVYLVKYSKSEKQLAIKMTKKYPSKSITENEVKDTWAKTEPENLKILISDATNKVIEVKNTDFFRSFVMPVYPLSDLENNISKYYGSGINKKRTYMMTWVDENDDKNKKSLRFFFPKETFILLICHKIVGALKFLKDKSYTHRDLKLSNIMIDENFEFKLTDHQLGRYINQKEKFNYPLVHGTVHYQGVDRFLENGAILTKNFMKLDIFSLGVILNYLSKDKKYILSSEQSKSPTATVILNKLSEIKYKEKPSQIEKINDKKFFNNNNSTEINDKSTYYTLCSTRDKTNNTHSDNTKSIHNNKNNQKDKLNKNERVEEYFFPEIKYSYSIEYYDFLYSLLELDMSLRLDIEDILKHKWFNQTKKIKQYSREVKAYSDIEFNTKANDAIEVKRENRKPFDQVQKLEYYEIKSNYKSNKAIIKCKRDKLKMKPINL